MISRLVLDASVALSWFLNATEVAGYDAVYFDLASRLALPIAAFDAGIRSACRNFGVDLVTAESI